MTRSPCLTREVAARFRAASSPFRSDLTQVVISYGPAGRFEKAAEEIGEADYNFPATSMIGSPLAP